MPGKLRNPLVFSGVVAADGTVSVEIEHNGYESVLELQQITVNYGVQGDSPTCQITVNGEVYSGGAVLLPSQGKNGQGGLAQTFGGVPYLYMESTDKVTVDIGNGSLGTLVTVHVQYRSLDYSAPELEGY